MRARLATLVALGVCGVLALVAAPVAPVAAQRATLPPTWTPTHTPSPLPTATITQTPTPTATLSPSAFCDQTFTVSVYSSTRSLAPTAIFDVLISNGDNDLFMRVVARHRLSEEAVATVIEGRTTEVLRLPMSALPRPGLYDWSVELLTADGEVLCQQGDYFFVQRGDQQRPTAPPAPTATPTPEGPVATVIVIVTATPDPNATPNVLIVTATPQQESIRERINTPTADSGG